jgi:rfaE bifunctional protein nucleotidyltransferase chain/domain
MSPPLRTDRKVLSLDDLTRLRAEAREAGLSVVQCHGCFDIVHPGHIRHLQFAAKQGDLLLVTITGDAAMRKGTGRPLIPQELRAENLAALDCVDWVHIDEHPTAAALLEHSRPDVYIKGAEYEHAGDARLDRERAVVEKHGGRIVFSSGDVVFSSTALIAALQQTADPLHRRIVELTEQHDLRPETLEPMISGFRGMRVVVVGQAITDTYILCDRPDVSGEGPVMSLRPIERRSYDGGAAMVARHLAAMGARVTLVTALPRSPEAEALRQRLLVEGVTLESIERRTPIPEKQRFLVGAQKVMKVDLVEHETLDGRQKQRIVDLARAQEADAAVVMDFGPDLIRAGMMPALCAALRGRVGTLTGDVSGRRSSLLHMRSMDLLTPSEAELRDAMHDYDDGLSAVVYRMLDHTSSRGAMISLGDDGLIAFDRVGAAEGSDSVNLRDRIAGEHIPAFHAHGVDPLGSGDALLAAATLGIACGASYSVAGVLGSLAASAACARLGNIPVSGADLRRGVRRLSESRLAMEEASRAAASVRAVS